MGSRPCGTKECGPFTQLGGANDGTGGSEAGGVAGDSRLSRLDGADPQTMHATDRLRDRKWPWPPQSPRLFFAGGALLIRLSAALS
jgi:hypothetical protein